MSEKEKITLAEHYRKMANLPTDELFTKMEKMGKLGPSTVMANPQGASATPVDIDKQTQETNIRQRLHQEESKAEKKRLEKIDSERAKTQPQGSMGLDEPTQPKGAKERYEELQKSKRGGGGGGAMPKSNRDITKNMKSGGKVSSASKRADGCAMRGKTKGRMV
jgi:hypothetical protein